MHRIRILTGSLVCIGAALTIGAGQLMAHQPPPDREPGFWRSYWYQSGAAHGNLHLNSRFRVNAAEASLDERFGGRSEVRGSGMMQIFIDEDPRLLAGAEIYAELWGGHPGTDSKRVSINGRRTYRIPDVGTGDGHCTHQYPRIPIQRSDLVNGYNALQFACSQGSTFWGHYIVDNACLAVRLKDDHPDLSELTLGGFDANLRIDEADAAEELAVSVEISEGTRFHVQAVHLQAHYVGYDENGDGHRSDWHGYTKERKPVAHLATISRPPYRWEWNTTMLPAQGPVQVQAIIEFRGWPELTYVTNPITGPAIEKPEGVRVGLFGSTDQPRPFWSRAGRVMECTIDVDVAPADIESAELHVAAWTGGPGEVKKYFQLNGHHSPVADGHGHEVIYSKLPIDPSWLKHGKNTIRLLSDTEHHGIEILRPGPAIMIRYKN